MIGIRCSECEAPRDWRNKIRTGRSAQTKLRRYRELSRRRLKEWRTKYDASKLKHVVASANLGAQRNAYEIVKLRAQNDVLKRQLDVAIKALHCVHDDSETGHWGPDVTMKDVLYEAMKEIERIGAE